MKKVAFMGIGIVSVLVIGISAYSVFLFKTLPNPSLFDQRHIAQSTKIYDRTGAVLLYELYGEQKRTVIPFNEIPTLFKQATIAIEDKNFYAHQAIDWHSLARAFITNIIHRRIVQGGSTITQQLAKNAFLKPDRTITRKLKEVILAYRLEQKYTKDKILNLYINQIPYGANAYGIEAAAQTYFHKNAQGLSAPEIALLVALPKAPTYYSPWGTHVDELMARKDRVLDELIKTNVISEKEGGAAKKTKIVFAPQIVNIKAPHFALFIQDYLIKTYGENFVRSAGLKITTTLDWDLQQVAERVVAEGAERNEKLYKGMNAALVAQDSVTGQVLALVGSHNYFDRERDGNFNVATQGLRQPGSAIKPLAYLTAFIQGYTPETVLFDVETEFDTTKDPQRSYKPQNFDERFRGPVTMREGLAQSINIPSVKTLYLAGINNTLAIARRMGITTLNEHNRYGLSLALGGGEVTLINLVQAYSVLSQDGVRHPQIFILKIEDARGATLEEYRAESEPVIETQYVRLVNDILSDNAARAPLFQNSLSLTTFPNQEVALKTGTTNDYRDAWTLGYTPSLVVGVWAGNNDNTPMERHGGSILAAVPIWHAFMGDVLKNKPLEIFPRPEPTTTTKPVLNNQFIINNEIHTILYYIDKKNPQGPPPSDHKNDPQFENWEQGVLMWAQNNNTARITSSTSTETMVDIRAPRNGDFVYTPLALDVLLRSARPLTKLEIYINDRLVDERQLNGTRDYTYQTSYTGTLDPQNKIVVTIIDDAGIITSKELIIFTR